MPTNNQPNSNENASLPNSQILQDSSNIKQDSSSNVLKSSIEKSVVNPVGSENDISLKFIDSKMDVDNSFGKSDMAIESMEVDSIDEKRENLKRQRDSSFDTKPLVSNEFPYEQSNSLSSTLINMISEIFFVNLSFDDIEPSEDLKITIPLTAFKEHSNSAHDYKNMVQVILMETTCNLVSEASTFDECLVYFIKLHPKNSSSFVDSLSNIIKADDDTQNFVSYNNKYILSLSYILDSIHKVYAEEKKTVDKCESPLIRDVFAAIKNQCFEFCSHVFLDSGSDPYLINFLIQLLYQGKLHYDFMFGFVSTTYHSPTFKKVFQPILQNIWLDMQAYSSLTLENHYKLPLQVLHELCSICIGKSNYPIGEIVSQFDIDKISFKFFNVILLKVNSNGELDSRSIDINGW